MAYPALCVFLLGEQAVVQNKDCVSLRATTWLNCTSVHLDLDHRIARSPQEESETQAIRSRGGRETAASAVTHNHPGGEK